MNPTITSANNPTIKLLRKLLTSSKARRDNNQYVAEGIHLVRSYLDGKGSPELYAVAESALGNEEVQALLEILDTTTTEAVVIADSLFSSLTSIHASVGILIVFSSGSLHGNALQLEKETTVILENIQDPGNIGTILRTVAAVGIQQVALSPGCASPWSPKALRAGMGAQFRLSIYEEADLARTLSELRLPVYATILAPHATSLYDANIQGPVVWLFGNEGQGISEALAGLATERIYIPQAASSVESLNVSAAAAVCLYEYYRQNK